MPKGRARLRWSEQNRRSELTAGARDAGSYNLPVARHPERSLPSRTARGSAVGLLVAVAISIAGCTAAPPVGPTSTADPGTSTPSLTASPTEGGPTAAPAPALVPDGSAYDNLPLFTAVTADVWSSADRASGRAYIDALVAAGFDKAAMQVTNDRTTIDNPAESIQFSVQWGDECLVGQVGPTTGDPVTAVFPVVPESGCLIGNTRPIDW